MKAWMRVLRVTLTMQDADKRGTRRQLVFGANEEQGMQVAGTAINGRTYYYASSDLSISVSGDKYMSTVKDSCTIKIRNLTYTQIVQIIAGKFYFAKVECGYRDGTTFPIFDGGVLYISNLRESVETNTVTILCASRMIAAYGQRRMNLSFNSGINLYSAIDFICRVGGVPNYNISTQFKKSFTDHVMNISNKNAADAINDLTIENGSFITSSDNVGGSWMTAYDASKSNCRIIKIDTTTLTLTSGFPRLTFDGLTFSVLPTFHFQCGDTLVIDNALIQLQVNSQSEAMKNLGGLLDANGQYILFQQHYELENRGNAFYIQMQCKTRSRITAYMGDTVG